MPEPEDFGVIDEDSELTEEQAENLRELMSSEEQDIDDGGPYNGLTDDAARGADDQHGGEGERI